LNYRLLGHMDREIALLNFEGKLQAVAEEKDQPSQTPQFGPWDVIASYGLHQFGPGNQPPGNLEPTGRALIAQLAGNRFLVAGFFCRVDFRVGDAAPGKSAPVPARRRGNLQEWRP